MPAKKESRNKRIVRLRERFYDPKNAKSLAGKRTKKGVFAKGSFLWITERINREFPEHRPITHQAVRQIYVRETTGVLLKAGAAFYRKRDGPNWWANLQREKKSE